MTEVKAGSHWTRKRPSVYASNKLEILATDGENAWVQYVDAGRGDVSLAYLFREFEIEKPFFEVGRVYARPCGNYRYTVKYVDQDDNGIPYAVSHRNDGHAVILWAFEDFMEA